MINDMNVFDEVGCEEFYSEEEMMEMRDVMMEVNEEFNKEYYYDEER